MIPLDAWARAAGEGICVVGREARRGVGVPGVQARFLYVCAGTVSAG